MPWTISEWCERWNISVPTFYDMQKRKVGPETVELPGIRAKRITEESEEKWKKELPKLANSKAARRAAEHRRQISSNAGRISAESPLHVSRAGKPGFRKVAPPAPGPKRPVARPPGPSLPKVVRSL